LKLIDIYSIITIS